MLIKLTLPDDKPVYIGVLWLSGMSEAKAGLTTVWVGDQEDSHVTVKESPDAIMAMIREEMKEL